MRHCAGYDRGRPEYLPILIAAVDAFLDPSRRSELAQATSGAPFPVVIVNGPSPNRSSLTLVSVVSAPTRNFLRARASGVRCDKCSRTSAVRYPAPAPWRHGATIATTILCLRKMKRACLKAGRHTPPNVMVTLRAAIRCRCFSPPVPTAGTIAAHRWTRLDRDHR